jgi:hypothetical protein
MIAGLESTQQSKMDAVTPTWTLTVTDRRLMWLQKQHPGAGGHKPPTLGVWSLQGPVTPRENLIDHA